MRKKSAEDYLDKLLNSVNDEKVKKEKFKETAKMLEDAVHFWEDERAAKDFEDASYMPNVVKEEKRSESEDFLDALLSGAQNTEFGMNKKKPDTNPMYSRRVSKSEADFLREFEAELAEDGDDYADLFVEYEDKIEPEDRLENEDIHVASVSEDEDSSLFGELDLDSIVNEAAQQMQVDTPVSYDDIPVQMDDSGAEVPLDDLSMLDMLMDDSEPAPAQNGNLTEEIPMDVFSDLFGDDVNLAEPTPVSAAPVGDFSLPDSSDSIDLSNLGESDLMNLLSGTDDLSDIGNMLSQSETTEIPLDGLDAFSAFAENEMMAQQISADPGEPEGEADKKSKKGGFIGKIKGILANLMKDDEEEIALHASKAPSAEMLAGENADILADMDSLEAAPPKKEKKKKEKKPKKEKAPKKPKAPKTPKPKKEKKPKEVDNTPPLPKGPVIMIWLMVASLFALVLLGVNMIGYNSAIANAKSLKNSGHYAEAFAAINGLDIKEKEMELYGQLAILSTVDSELNAYAVFDKNDMPDKAFDSLICAAGRCELNAAEADVFECLGQLEILKKNVSNELEQKYGMSYEEALEMYSIRDRDDYTIALYKKLTELGIEWE